MKPQTLKQIVEGCWIGGCTLEQRLATIRGYTDDPRYIEESRLIVEHLARPQEEGDAIFLKAIGRRNR